MEAIVLRRPAGVSFAQECFWKVVRLENAVFALAQVFQLGQLLVVEVRVKEKVQAAFSRVLHTFLPVFVFFGKNFKKIIFFAFSAN